MQTDRRYKEFESAVRRIYRGEHIPNFRQIRTPMYALHEEHIRELDTADDIENHHKLLDVMTVSTSRNFRNGGYLGRTLCSWEEEEAILSEFVEDPSSLDLVRSDSQVSVLSAERTRNGQYSL